MKIPLWHIILVTVFCAAVALVAVCLKKDHTPPPDQSALIKTLQDSLAHQNAANARRVDLEVRNKLIYAHMVDSLMKLPPKFKTEYINAEKHIDKATARQLAAGFDSIFSANNVNH